MRASEAERAVIMPRPPGGRGQLNRRANSTLCVEMIRDEEATTTRTGKKEADGRLMGPDRKMAEGEVRRRKSLTNGLT